MRLRFKATHVVLAMLCVMYFITYVDRVNIGTAASEIQKELGLSNTQLGLVFSAFAYPYLLFQVIGGLGGELLRARPTVVLCGAEWGGGSRSTRGVCWPPSVVLARASPGLLGGAAAAPPPRALA